MFVFVGRDLINLDELGELNELFCRLAAKLNLGLGSSPATAIIARRSKIQDLNKTKNVSFLQRWQGSITKLNAHSGPFPSSPDRGSDSFGFSCFAIGDSGRESGSCSFSFCKIGDSGREDKRPSSSDWRSTWLGSASQISSSYAFVLNFSVISSMKMLYMVESMFRETRKIMNQSPVDAFVTRW